jgi:adenosylcobinamide-phosphate synthase
MDLSFNLITILCALLLEAALGYPRGLFRRIKHPVMWMGTLLDLFEARMNQESMPEDRRRLNGMIGLGLLLVVTILLALALQLVFLRLLPRALAILVLAIVASAMIAQASLNTHVKAVADALDARGAEDGRVAVAKIVGRDTESLDATGVARAAIESLAENFSDGVVAPALWCAVAGLPGIAAYKAANTADSMIGHLSPRYRAFGWAAAKLDDLLNLPASRLAALWLVLAALVHRDANASAALATVRADARRHRSPNAGWPEAAMAGALGLKLAGPRAYHGRLTQDTWIGCGRSEATVADIRRALSLYQTACAVQISSFGLLALLIALS